MKAKITYDLDNEMLSIENEKGKSLFYGNEWDFCRDADSFKCLFEGLGVEVEMIEAKMPDEYNEVWD